VTNHQGHDCLTAHLAPRGAVLVLSVTISRVFYFAEGRAGLGLASGFVLVNPCHNHVMVLLAEDGDVIGAFHGVLVVSTDTVVHCHDEVVTRVSCVESASDEGGQVGVVLVAVAVDEAIHMRLHIRLCSATVGVARCGAGGRSRAACSSELWGRVVA